MGESCVQGLGHFAVVGTFPFSDFHETTEQTKMASLVQHDGGRRLQRSDLESRIGGWKNEQISRESFLVHLKLESKTGPLKISSALQFNI